MKSPTLVTVGVVPRWVVGSMAWLGCVVGIAAPLAAQDAPPIDGVTGTIALKGTVESEYTAANTVIVKTLDGVRHVFHYTADLLVHGGNGTGVDALRGLREGSTVVVHYTVAGTEEGAHEIDRIGDEGLSTTEGTVTHIDRSRKHITVGFDGGHTEMFQLTDGATIAPGQEIDRAPVGTAWRVLYRGRLVWTTS